MTRSLRERHRWIVVGMAALLPVLLALGLGLRRPVPAYRNAIAAETSLAGVLWSRTDLWPNLVETRLVRLDSQEAIQIRGNATPLAPDLLIYSTQEAGVTDALPQDAVFRGAFHPEGWNTIQLREGESSRRLALLLYSLAKQEVVAASKPFQAGSGRGG